MDGWQAPAAPGSSIPGTQAASAPQNMTNQATLPLNSLPGLLQQVGSAAGNVPVALPQLGGFPGGLPPFMQLPIPAMNDPVMLSKATGFNLKMMNENPGMMLAAQQIFAQRLLHQQLLAGQLMRPGMMPQNLPQMQAMQAAALAQQQQQQQQQQQTKSKGSSGKSGKGGKKPKSDVNPQGPFGAQFPLVKEDPGGKVIWAKLPNYPWWPAKTLDPAKDRSYPPDADPPRPTAIPVRFFGTHEFAWVGSKRAITEWEEGLPQFSAESDQEAFKAAIKEAEEYRGSGTLPDVFYAIPDVESGKRGGKGKKRGGSGRKAGVGEEGSIPGSARPRSGRAVAGAAEDREALVQERKKQRLLDMGLAPPAESPYASGQVAPNPALLEKANAWAAEFPSVMAAAREAAAKETAANEGTAKAGEGPSTVKMMDHAMLAATPVAIS